MATPRRITRRPTVAKALPPLRPPRRYTASLMVPHLTPQERIARGRAARGDQNERDYAVFSKAVKAGRNQAVTGL